MSPNQIRSKPSSFTNSLVRDPSTEIFLAGGSLFGALAASSCCVVPVLLLGAGASGAWLGNLYAFGPYQPVFVATALGFLGAGFYAVYRRKTAIDCVEHGMCANPRSKRWVRVILWSSAVLTITAIVFPYVAPLVLTG